MTEEPEAWIIEELIDGEWVLVDDKIMEDESLDMRPMTEEEANWLANEYASPGYIYRVRRKE